MSKCRAPEESCTVLCLISRTLRVVDGLPLPSFSLVQDVSDCLVSTGINPVPLHPPRHFAPIAGSYHPFSKADSEVMHHSSHTGHDRDHILGKHSDGQNHQGGPFFRAGHTFSLYIDARCSKEGIFCGLCACCRSTCSGCSCATCYWVCTKAMTARTGMK